MMRRLIALVTFLSVVVLVTHQSAAAEPDSWEQVGTDIHGEQSGDLSGHPMALSADGVRLAIASPVADGGGEERGTVRVFEWDGDSWAQIGQAIHGGQDGDKFGTSVAIDADGSRLAIGTPRRRVGPMYNPSGLVLVYELKYAVRPDFSLIPLWVQMGVEIEGDPGELLGSTVALSADGSRLAVGLPYRILRPAVRVFDWTGATWVQVGADLLGTLSSGEFGTSVALSEDGSRLAVGEHFHERPSDDGSGHAQVYEWTGADWVRLGAGIEGEGAGDFLGFAVALSADGSRLAVGAPLNDSNGDDSGHVRVFDWTGAAWVQMGQDVDGEASEDRSGGSVSLSSDGSRLAVGAPLNQGSGHFRAGHVRVYDLRIIGIGVPVWVQVGDDVDGEASQDRSGSSVGLSADGSRLAVGAPFSDGNGVDSGQVRVFEYGAVPNPMCHGLPVTVDLNKGQVPTTGSDVILGTPKSDHILSLDGDDVVCAEGGDDTVDAGPGDDTVEGSSGRDHIRGGEGDDTIDGGDGNDRLFGDAGADVLRGADGRDVVRGGPGADIIEGGPRNDRLSGNGGADLLRGGNGRDSVFGNGGNDQLIGGGGNDRLYGGAGIDSVDGRIGIDRCQGEDLSGCEIRS